MASWVVAEVTELRSLLESPTVQKDPQLYLKAVQKVIASMTLGIDVSSLFSEMIKAGGTQNPVQKKLVYLYLENYAESNSDLALMTVNTLLKDFADRNPILRGQALRALCSLRLPDVTKYKNESLQIGLKDSSAYVRKTAVMGVLKLHHTQPDIVDKMNFVDILYQMLRDGDPQVVVNCIAALSEILASEGGMVVNTKIAHYLLNRLEDFNEWGQCQVLNLVTSYTPSGEEEIFDILNMVDDRFKHRNSGVVLGAIHLFIHFTQGLPQLQKDVYSRIHTPMLSFLCTDYIELLYTYLYHAQLLLANNSNLWRHDYKSFYCRYTDLVPIKLKKVEMLSEICMFESTRDIVSELSVYATDVNSMVACQSIKAVGTIALRIPSKANICIDQLISLLNLKVDYVTSEVVVVMKDILRKFEDMLEYVLPKLPTSLAEFTSSEGKSALLWILGEYGESLPNTPYVLEDVVNGVSEEPSAEVKLELLSALTKMFFKRPPECQEMLGRLLDYCINDENNQDVRDRAMLYYRLLKVNLPAAKKVVCGQPKIILYDDSTIARKSALLKEFNTLAVLFNKPSREFITQKTPYIMVNEESGSSGAESSFERTIKDDEPFDSDEWKRVRHDSFSSLHLNPEALISAGDFEKKWTELQTAKEIHLCLDSVPSSEEFAMTLNSQSILTMASSPPKNPVVKHFMYAQNASTNHFFLVEVNMSTESNMFSFLLKCENSKQATLFTKYFLQSLVSQ